MTGSKLHRKGVGESGRMSGLLFSDMLDADVGATEITS